MAQDQYGQLTLGNMPRRLFRCTPSRLAAFDCPRRYRFTYLDRPAPTRGPAWAHNTMGAVVHLALAQWFTAPAAQRTPEAGENAVHRNWQSAGFRDEEQSRSWREIAGTWVNQYLRRTDGNTEPVGVERTVSVPTSGLAVSGRVDRIDERDGELVVVDYKTGRRALDVDDARGSQALALYALAVRRTLRKPCTKVELHHLPTGHIARWEHSEQSLARHVERAEATAQDIEAATDTLAAGADADEVFPPRPGALCSWCDFRALCPEGQHASAERAPWDGLAEPVT